MKDVLHDSFENNSNASNSGMKSLVASSNGLLLCIDSIPRLHVTLASSCVVLIQTNTSG